MTKGQILIGDMSHETAIGILKLMLEAMEVYDSISSMPERVNAVKMGIEALERESNNSEIPTSSTTKNNLGVDCVARQDVERYIEGFINEYTTKEELEFINLELDGLKHIPLVTPISKECIDCIAEDKTFLKMDEVKQLLNSDKLDDLEILKKIREVVAE